MYKVAQTSHGVLLLTDLSFYQSASAKRFLKNIDLQCSRPLVDSFQEIWHQAPMETTNRKYGVKKFCTHYLHTHPQSQVIVLGGGLDPFSLEIAESYPSSYVFDVDMDNTTLKEKLTREIHGPDNINFCQSNIANAQELSSKLQKSGWKRNQQTLIICEGISYYLSPKQLKEAIQAIKSSEEGAVVLEYGRVDEEIYPEEYRNNVQRAYTSLKEKISWPTPLTRYSQHKINELAKNLGADSTTIIDQTQIEKEKTGENKFFTPPSTGVYCVAYLLFFNS